MADQEKRYFGNPRELSWIATRHLLAAIFGIVLVLILLALPITSPTVFLVATGGFAGAATSSLSALLRRAPDAPEESPRALSAYLLVGVPIVSGFAAGAFSIILIVGLFQPHGSTVPGAAVCGGIFALLLAGWEQRLYASPRFRQAVEVIDTAVNADAASLRVRYNGRVAATFKAPPGELELVRGSLVVQFFAGVEGNTHLYSAQILAEEGAEAPTAIFLVTVVTGSGIDAYPRSRVVEVPTDGPSQPFEFTIIRDTYATTDRDEPRPGALAGSALIDVAQAAHTLQLLEVPLSTAPEPR
ncbi:hypothetical protein J5X84_41220 [Streptosporangiaceae bacterium NEAU-GS5]|nr:hypothetical protein [Streptosporangiaceae bacterium NEAU-GS5]